MRTWIFVGLISLSLTSCTNPISGNLGSESSSLNITSLAGQRAKAGYADGVGTNARFSGPRGLATDGTYLYIADTANHCIRKMLLSTGEVTTVAGSGSSGSQDGIGTAASFHYPHGVTVAGAYLFVTDGGNHTIRRIEIATGTVSTFAGTPGASGSTNATGSAARFNSPDAIVNDGTNLYLIDHNNHTVRQVVIATGAATTLAGQVGVAGSSDGVGTAASFYFNNAGAIAIDENGDLFVSDISHPIRKIVVSTQLVTSFGASCETSFALPTGACFGFGWGLTGALAVSGSDVYFINSSLNIINHFPVGGGPATTIAGRPNSPGFTDGIGSNALLNFGTYKGGGIIKIANSLYFSDTHNQSIRKIDLSTNEVTVVAGIAATGQSAGASDGTGTAASFDRPMGLATDGTNLFVADALSNTVRKVVIATGVVTTLAGSPYLTGSADGVGAAARFNFAHGSPALATNGTDLYVADYWNCTVRKIVIASQTVTTIAGTAGSCGTVDGTGAAAEFSRPHGLVLNGGDLYVADNQLRKVVLSSAAVTTLGAVGGISGQLATDGTYIYATDGFHVLKITIADGTSVSLAGDGAYGDVDGTGSAARFGGMYGVATDGTNVYVHDDGFGHIKKVVIATGVVTTIATEYRSELEGSVRAGGHFALVGSSLYYTHPILNGIFKLNAVSGTGDIVAGRTGMQYNWGYRNGSAAYSAFDTPGGFALVGTDLYIADSWNATIRKLDTITNTVSTFAGSGWDSTDGIGFLAKFNGIGGLASDGTYLYTADIGNNTIRRIAIANGAVTTIAGTPGVTSAADGTGPAAGFDFGWWSADLATDGTHLYILDTGNNSIRKLVLSSGVVTTLAGTGSAGAADGVGTAASFRFRDQNYGLGGLTYAAGFVYVADYGNHTVRKINVATGVVSTLAGSAGLSGFTEGAGAAARFTNPLGITNDGIYLYVSDFGNHTIRKIKIATGEVTTYAGSPSKGVTVDGTSGVTGFLFHPSSLHMTSLGLVFSDGWSSIRLIH